MSKHCLRHWRQEVSVLCNWYQSTVKCDIIFVYRPFRHCLVFVFLLHKIMIVFNNTTKKTLQFTLQDNTILTLQLSGYIRTISNSPKMKKSAITKSDFQTLLKRHPNYLFIFCKTQKKILENIGNQTLVPSDFNVTSQISCFMFHRKKGEAWHIVLVWQTTPLSLI